MPWFRGAMSLTISRFEAAWGVRLLASLAISLAGCGAAAGHGWVDDPRGGHPPVTSASQAQPVSALGTTEGALQGAARPRLNHTVTLGEIEVAAADPTAGAPSRGGAGNPSVTINNYNVVNLATPAGYGYAALGYGPASPSFSAGSAAHSSSAAVTPGQSWPVIADHGPSFPYQSGPGSPWARQR